MNDRDSVRSLIAVAAMVVAVAGASRVEAAESAPNFVSLDVVPPAVRLDSPRRTMRLVVTGTTSAGTTHDLSESAAFTSSHESVAVVRDGRIEPRGDGTAMVRVAVGSLAIEVPVVVRNFKSPDPVSFGNEVLAALTKQGCNAGACHGSPSGKGGFRLSLRGFDAELDRLTLLREAPGRRVNPSDADASLLLLKPTMQVPHAGGRRLAKTDAAHAALRDWIAEGCRAEAADAPVCRSIEVHPPRRVLDGSADRQRFLILANFSDGSTRDVTPLADFSTSDDRVVAIDPTGLATGRERGEAVVVVRYLDQIVTAPITRLVAVDRFTWNAPSPLNEVDRLVFAQLQRLQIAPSAQCDDGEFLRRASLDVIGLLPTPAETRRFLADPSPNKREALVDALLERPEFAEMQTLQWGDLLRLKASRMGTAGMHKFHRWLLSAMRENVPYDRFARELLTAEGSTFDRPAAAFFRASPDPALTAETVAQLFLGLRIQCAKCHNHPQERWTQDNYYGLAAVFSRVKQTDVGERGETLVWASTSGDVTHPRTGRTMPPVFPLKGETPVPDGVDRRAVFADWLVAPDNPFFAKVGVNRLWGRLFGRGLVEPVDDFRESNPPSNGPLLDHLAAEFVRSGYDQKAMYRLILSSRVYQLGSLTNEFNADDVKHFSRHQPRLLSAEQLLDAIAAVTGVGERFKGLPDGIRAVQLPSPEVRNDFLTVFGQPARETPCDCERSRDPKLTQALQLMSGDFLAKKLASPESRLSQRFDDTRDRPLIEDLYLSAYCRLPSAAETATALDHLRETGDRRKGLEDLHWAVLNSDEFLFQH